MAKGFFSRAVEYLAETSRDIIGRILGMGVNKSEIARSLGIDSSTITQIEKGNKPGANLTADLARIERELAGAEKPKEAIADIHLEPPKRLTREGEPVRVREGAADREARAEAEREEARGSEMEAVGAEGMTITISGVMGTSKDFRERTVSVDLDPDEAIEFLTMWDIDRDKALDICFQIYGAPLSVNDGYSIQFS